MKKNIYLEQIKEMLDFVGKVALEDGSETYWWEAGFPAHPHTAASDMASGDSYWFSKMAMEWEEILEEMAKSKMLALLVEAKNTFGANDLLIEFDKSLYMHYIRLAIELMEDDFWEEVEDMVSGLNAEDRRKLWRENAS